MYTSSKKIFRKNPDIAVRVDDCVKKIVKAFKPKKIILFGSFSRGELKKSGTLDLLIISNTKLSFFKRIKKALLTCKGDDPPIEPLIYTPREFNLLWKQGEGFLEEAVEEGYVLYKKGK